MRAPNDLQSCGRIFDAVLVVCTAAAADAAAAAVLLVIRRPNVLLCCARCCAHTPPEHLTAGESIPRAVVVGTLFSYIFFKYVRCECGRLSGVILNLDQVCQQHKSSSPTLHQQKSTYLRRTHSTPPSKWVPSATDTAAVQQAATNSNIF